jgi:8-oxo-dGTP pyrophosphatase MutT (NUDIX family)
MAPKKSAIIPYRFVKKRLQIMLVTTSSGNKWIIPKGNIEPSLPPAVSAAKEAREEAGVLGKPHSICVGKYDSRKHGPIPVFLLKVHDRLKKKDWLENHKRKRKWVDADHCAQFISNDDLLTVIKKGVQCLRSEEEYFIQAMRTYGEQYKWTLSKITKSRAKLEVRMPSPHKQILPKLRNILKKSGIRKRSKLLSVMLSKQ